MVMFLSGPYLSTSVHGLKMKDEVGDMVNVALKMLNLTFDSDGNNDEEKDIENCSMSNTKNRTIKYNDIILMKSVMIM